MRTTCVVAAIVVALSAPVPTAFAADTCEVQVIVEDMEPALSDPVSRGARVPCEDPLGLFDEPRVVRIPPPGPLE